MRSYRYVRLDPTGNLTCLVLDPTAPEDEPLITRTLLQQCEQVAYLEPPERPGSAAAIRLMGGEFCGNAAMATAAWLVRDELKAGEETSLLLEVSGAETPTPCRICRTSEGFEGTVRMPGTPRVSETVFQGLTLAQVRLKGIVHLICRNQRMEKERAEELLRRIAAQLPDEAAGLLQWDREARFMQPLVYVRGSDSMVWEHGCGSGSAAVGAYEAMASGDGKTVIPVRQPGGIITVTAEIAQGAVCSVSITGKVRLGTEQTITINESGKAT